MSNLTDFDEKLADIEAIAEDDVRAPSTPVDSYLQEAENLSHWCSDDATQLAVVGITIEKINDLPVRAGALREAQSRWFRDRYSREEAQREWDTLSPAAYDLRDELIHTFRYAYRNDETILSRISEIADGTGNEDMIQDLNDLSVLGKANPEPLVSIMFDVLKLDTAAEKADTMADLLATANGEKAGRSESKLIRDKAYTYLKELVDEIRAAGKYVFWKDEARYRGYLNQYRRTHHS